jgi:hypothetical protein
VRGRWPFPADMLRYDSAEPSTEGDRGLVELLSGRDGICPDGVDMRQKYRVTLRCDMPRPGGGLSVDRWRSFGWEVLG